MDNFCQPVFFRLRSSCILLVAFLFVYLSPVFGVDENQVARQYNFREYSVFDGLPQGQVTSIQQDERGYIWVGSYAGITRYNGIQFDTFTQPLPSNTIRSIVHGKNGQMVIGTAAGLCYLKNDNFRCESHSEKLPFVNLFQIFVAENGELWVGSDNGLMHITPEETITYQKEQGLPSHTVRIALQDRNGRVWAGTGSGLAYLKEDKFILFKDSDLGKVSIRSMLDTKEGLWVGANNGLYFISHKTQELQKIGGELFKGSGVLALFKDSRDILWMGTYRGLYRMVDGKIEQLAPQKGLKRVTTYSITEDKDGTIWIGSDAGLIKYVPGPFVTYTTEQGLSHDFIRAISVAEDGKVWLGIRHGVSIFNPQNESITTLIKELKQDNVRIYGIQNLPDNSVLIGTQTGLIHWKNDKVVEIFADEEILPSIYISAFHVDKKSNVWVATSRGLVRWEKDHLVPVKQSDFKIGGIYSMQSDLQGRIWLGTGNQGVVVFDPELERYLRLENIPQASEYTVWSIDRDSQGNMWVGTNGNGLLEISENFKLIKKFDQENGLKNNYLWQVMVDSRDDIWAFTNNGLKRYDGEKFTHFDGSDGLPDLEGAATAVAEHPNGELYFGTAFGLTVYTPKNEEKINQPPPIIIESLQYNEQPIKNDQEIAYGNGTLTARFASLSYKNEREVEFIYRLLGADEKWSEPQKNNRTQFVNLRPGHYEFQVKAIQEQRILSNSPASISFTVTPPFWLTWWFILFCSLLLIGGIAKFVYYRLQILARERDRLEVVVSERTSELISINKELNRLVTTDELTKLFNRRHLIECLEKEIKRLSRCPENSTLAFIILDVDYFKKINDSYGHTAGDRVLQQLANNIRQCSRETDVCARYGGEEFAMILPFTEVKGALVCGEKIRQEISENEFLITHQRKIQVTVSLGISALTSEYINQKFINTDQIIREADAALYRAKEQGRNQVCLYNAKLDVSL